jgi:hypothetical protein
MDKRYRFARLCTIISAAVFVVCFAIASGAFMYASRLRDQGVVELGELKEQVKTLKAEGEIVKARLNDLSNANPTPALRESIVSWHGIVAPSNEDVQKILIDSSLSDRDKLTALILATTRTIDRDIDEQSTRVKAISDSGSIDVETMKLKRLLDRRSQMYDVLRQQIDRYNREAKEIIDSMGR